MKDSKISILIPTYNGKKYLENLFNNLDDLERFDVIFIDSQSTDGTWELINQSPHRSYNIQQSDFRHGKTRNELAKLAKGEVLVYLTQDALPQNSQAVFHLVEPILKGDVHASYGKQTPRLNSSPLEYFHRKLMYDDQYKITEKSNVTNQLSDYYFSNSFSAYSKNVFFELKGFDESLISNEDMELAYRFIYSGFKVSYNPKAICEHSHHYSLFQRFKRQFDVSVFLVNHHKLGKLKKNSTGLYLAKKTLFDKWPSGLDGSRMYAFLELLVSLFGSQCGKHYRLLPNVICKKFSSQLQYWLE